MCHTCHLQRRSRYLLQQARDVGLTQTLAPLAGVHYHGRDVPATRARDQRGARDCATQGMGCDCDRGEGRGGVAHRVLPVGSCMSATQWSSANEVSPSRHISDVMYPTCDGGGERHAAMHARAQQNAQYSETQLNCECATLTNVSPAAQ